MEAGEVAVSLLHLPSRFRQRRARSGSRLQRASNNRIRSSSSACSGLMTHRALTLVSQVEASLSTFLTTVGLSGVDTYLQDTYNVSLPFILICLVGGTTLFSVTAFRKPRKTFLLL
jgi:hypothetical protein